MVQEIILLVISLFIYTFIYNYKSKISNFFKLIDNPNEDRKIHSNPTPLLGGLIIFYLFVIGLSKYSIYFSQKEMLIFLFIILFFFIIGIIDDIKKLGSYLRLIILFFSTYLFLNFSDYFLIKELSFAHKEFIIHLDIFAIFITVLCIMLLVNALNLADGINGLSTMLIVSWSLYIKFILFNDLSFIGLSNLVILLIVFFHIYNGKYFMGDAGVTTSAAIIGLLSIASYNFQEKNFTVIHVEEIFLLFFIPGLDMFRLFIKRILKKKDPFTADGDHLHHLLIKKFNLKSTLIIYFFISFLPISIYKFATINSLILIVSYSALYFIFLGLGQKKYF